MPFLEAPAEDEILLRSPLGQNLPKPPTFSADLLGTAFRQENSLVSTIARAREAAMPPEPGHNPLDIIKDTSYESDYLDNFVTSRSEGETRQIMARIDAENERRAQLESAGPAGFVAMTVAGLLDPVNFLPGGAIVKGVRGGYQGLRTARNVGVAAGVATAAQEIALQGTQETRTAGESAVNIGASTLLGAFIGGGAAALLTKAERSAMADGFVNQTRRDINMDSGVGAAVADERELVLRDFTGPVGRAVEGAAKAAERIPYVGRAAAATLRAPGALMERTSPTMTVFSSPFLSGRRLGADLMETVLEFEGAAKGIPTTYGVPLSRHAEMVKDKMRIAFADELDRLYMDYRFGRQGVIAPKLRADLARFTGQDAEGRMTFGEFKEAAARAAREGDTHEVPQVAEAARSYRRTIGDPLKDKATMLKLFAEDMEGPKGDTSHLFRAYNKEAINQNPNGFVAKVANWYKGEQTKKAKAQERIAGLWRDLKDVAKQQKKLGGRVDTQAGKLADLESRLSERGMEVARTGKRFKTVEERKALEQEEIADLSDFLEELKDTASSPELAERVKMLEGDLRILKAVEQRATVSEKDLAKIERQEVAGVLAGPMRRVANVLTGRAKAPKPPSFLAYLAKKGGIRDTGGDIRSMLGGRKVPGLIRNISGKQIDVMVQDLRAEFPEYFGGAEAYGKDSPDLDLLRQAIDDAANGKEPDWFVDSRLSEADRAVYRGVEQWQAALGRVGVDVKNPEDVAAMLRGDNPAALADLDRVAAEMEAANASAPPVGARERGEGRLAAEKEGIAALRRQIAQAKTRLEGKSIKEGQLGARSDEALIAAKANRGRLGILTDRADRADIKKEILEAAQRLADENEAAMRGKLEEEITAWEGKSTTEAKSSLKGRDKQEPREDGQRRTGADKQVEKAVKTILKSNRDLSDQDLQAIAVETMNRIVAVPDGRLPYDVETPSPQRGGGEDMGPRRGALIGRQFAIPSREIEEFLVNDIEELSRRTVNTLVPDMLMMERFGHVEMQPQFKALQEEVASQGMAAKTPAEAAAIRAEGERVENALRAVAGRIRGTYGYSSNPTVRNLGRVARVVRNANYMADLGGTAMLQFVEAGGVVTRAGFQNALRHAWIPLFKKLAGNNTLYQAQRKQAKAMGIGLETYLHSRAHSLGDIADATGEGSRFERTMASAAQGFSKINLMGPMTDMMKVAASSAVSNDILAATKAVSAGTATPKQISDLASSNITPQMAKDIWSNASASGGMDEIEGTLVPNTDAWENKQAAQQFEAAVARETDIAIISPGQEKPLWMSTPMGGLLGQFKTFVSAANERILLANLQRRDARALSGFVTYVALGMLSYKLYSIATGKPTSDRPQDWFKEGLDRSGMLGWLSEANAMTAKASRGSFDMYRMIGADKPLSRYASRSIWGSLLGPTAGKIESLVEIGGSASAAEWTAADTKRLRRLFAGQNLFYLRLLFDEVEKETNAVFGIPEKLN